MTSLRKIPAAFEDMTAEWLTEVIPAEFRGGHRVSSAICETIGSEGSFVGDIARLNLTYEAPAGIPAVIGKLPTRNQEQRQRFASMGFYRKENAFYRDLAASTPARVPSAYFIAENEPTIEYVLLLEDLGDMRTGDHLQGCTDDEANLVVEELAKLHARWWNDSSLDAYQSWLPPASEAQAARSSAWFASVLPTMRITLRGMVPHEFIAFADTAAERAPDIWGLQSQSPFAVAHGDCRLENFMFGPSSSSSRIALVDWQAVTRGSPLRDLSYFLATNFEVERRRKQAPELIRRYHDALLAKGVTNYALEECRTDLRRADLLLAWAAFWVAGSLDPESPNAEAQELLRTVIGRQAQALMDSEPGQLLTR
jgi:thiamine kinase-like enzyme